MNDGKAAVINMLSEGTITASEGIALLEALCDLEGRFGVLKVTWFIGVMEISFLDGIPSA